LFMSLSTLFDGRIGSFLAVIIALCVVGLVVVFVMRALGRGIKPSTGRRLGIVDAFDLDRHRQLVIIRRDNVEHLIMIGGPNDLVIESDIVRAQPMIGEGRREPMVAPAAAAPPAPPPPPSPAAPPVPPPMQAMPPMPRVTPPPPPPPRPAPRAPEPAAPPVEPPAVPEKAKEPRLSVNINSLEEEMSRLLGRPPEKKE
jgi:hypothetical protein